MGEIDMALIQAWESLPEATRKVRVGLVKRRRELGIRPRPVRPWCVAIRAADLRINPYWCIVEPDDAADPGAGQTVTITGDIVRKLCKPVRNDWPGIDWCLAADKLGRHPESLRPLIKRGVFEARMHPPRPMGKKGKPVPVVWSEWPLDPGASNLKGPDAHWGSIWQWHWERVPLDMEFSVRRKARYVDCTDPYRGWVTRKQWGWYFFCPRCGKRSARLYYPLAPLTIVEYLGEVPPEEENSPPRRAAQQQSSKSEQEERPFACRACHKILNLSLVQANGWNLFVQCLSGGVLYGREVKRPETIKVVRKRVFRRRCLKNVEGHDQMLGLLRAGLTFKQIAARLGRSTGAVARRVERLRTRYGARSRTELVEKARWVVGRVRVGKLKEVRGRGA